MTSLRDAIDYTTLGWVKPEVDETLRQARMEIEGFAENPGDATRMRFCVGYLHQVQGTLRMVELYAPAMVVEEMEQLALALQLGDIADADRDPACATLMRGVVLLPDYLERLQSGHRDIPIVLLPLLNELRSARGQKGLSESVLFAPDLARPLPALDAADAAPPETGMLPLVERLSAAVAAWPEDGVPADAGELHDAIEALLALTRQEDTRRMLWVASGLASALRDGQLAAIPSLRQAFASVQREARRQFEDDRFGSPNPETTLEPTRQLLYHVALGDRAHPALAELRTTFDLDAQQPSESELSHAQSSLTGRNRALLDTVAGAVKEDLLRVKDALDLHLRATDADVAGLQPQVESLSRVADTLGMLGLGVARGVVQQQRDAMQAMVNGERKPDESALLDVAGALLYVDATLDDQVARLGGSDAAGGSDDLFSAESRQLMEVIAREAIANFADARQAFVAFVETSWDHAELSEVPRLLHEVSGAMTMLELPQPAAYLDGVRMYAELELIGRKRVPNGRQLDTFADALASLEYYLEALREHRGNRDNILDIARNSLESLGYWPLPQPVAATDADVAQSAHLASTVDLDQSTADDIERTLASFVDSGSDIAIDAAAPDHANVNVNEREAAVEAATATPAIPRGYVVGGFEVVGDEIDDEIRDIFIEEFGEEIDNLSAMLPPWRDEPDNLERLRPIRRVFHTLKGSGRLVGARVLGEFSWKVETMLNRVLDKTREPTPAVVAMVDTAYYTLPQLLAVLRGEATTVTADLGALQAIADRITEGEELFAETPAVETPTSAVESQADVPASVPASVDALLLEILQTEVSGHLVTLDDWLVTARAEPVHASDALLRSTHTMNGAFAMVDVPSITDALGPAEGYIRRLYAAGELVDAEGVAALSELTQLVRATMAALETPAPMVPTCVALAATLTALRDRLPDKAYVPGSSMGDDEADALLRNVMMPDVPETAAPEVEPVLDATLELTDTDLSRFGNLAETAGVVAGVIHATVDRLRGIGDDDAGATSDRIEAERARQAEAEMLVTERIAAERDEALRADAERVEAERVATERLEAERLEAENVEAEKLETERLESERFETERLEAERMETELFEARQLEAERIEAERLEAERVEAERVEAEHIEAKRVEAERLEAESAEAAKLEAERIEAERLEAERVEDERVEAERTEEAKLEAERLEAERERVQAEKLDAERVESDQLEADRLAAEEDREYARLEAEYAEADRLAREQQSQSERDVAERAEADRQQAEADAAAESARLDTERLETEQATAERAELERVETERVAAERLESERLEAERLDSERVKAERLEAERVEVERVEAERVEAERFEAGRLEAQRVEVERVEAERLEAERIEVERVEGERLEAERVEAERLDAERVEAERLEAERIEAERVEADRLDAERAEAERADIERRDAENASADEAAVTEMPDAPVDPVVAAMLRNAQGIVTDPDGEFDLAGLDPELVDIFVEEAGDLLDHSDGLLAQLREVPTEREPLVGLQRDLHTIKGGARMAGVMAIGELGHAMESLLEAVVDQRSELGLDGVPLLERGFDRLHAMVTRVGARLAVDPSEALIAQFTDRALGRPRPVYDNATPGETRLPAPRMQLGPLSTPLSDAIDLDDDDIGVRAPQEQVRIRADLLDRLVTYAGEVAIYRARLEQQLGAFRGAMGEMEQTNMRLRDQLRRLDIETEAQIVARFQREQDVSDKTFDPLELDRFSTLQQLSRALGESAADMSSLQGTLDDLTRQYETLLLQQSRVSSDLQEGLMRTRMVPFDALVPRLRRVVRQAASDTGKQVQLRLDGAQGELDRNVLERMTAPLEHMLRNAVAHGVEDPKARRKARKSDEGTVRVAVRREGSEVVLEVSDDGTGLNRQAIRMRAEERGLLRADAVLADSDLDAMILQPGFSTAGEVSRLAGRGVGMDVVASEVRQLGGTLDIASRRGEGTTFTLRLPQTLAVTQAVFVKIGEVSFALPIASVRGAGRLTRADFEAGNPTYAYGGEDYAVHDLGGLVGQPAAKAEGQLQMPVLLIRSGDLRAAVVVDQILGNREIVVKPVGPQVASIPGIFGATVMGDGRVVVILDVAPLVRRRAALPRDVEPAQPVEQRQVPLVMVVDDSVTMRKVTGRVLERHNFEVASARDGIDAIERMVDRVPDLMLLDIEMPRMDGYELATHMKADPRLRDVPIVMITSRTGEKHRQRAFEIGVERYLGKPYQENELIRTVYELLRMEQRSDG